MPEPLTHPPGVRVCRPCPIESCDWHHDEPDHGYDAGMPVLVKPSAEQVAEHAGDYMAAAIFATVLADVMEIEAALVEHFTTEHTLLDWATEVVRLQQEAARLVTLGCQCPCHTGHPAGGCTP